MNGYMTNQLTIVNGYINITKSIVRALEEMHL